jgi:hypothetical protein
MIVANIAALLWKKEDNALAYCMNWYFGNDGNIAEAETMQGE